MKNIETILYTDMKRYALRMCNGNIHDAEDMVQDLAYRILKRIGSFINKEYDHLKSLMYTELAEVKVHNYRRSSAQKRTMPDNYNHRVIDNDVWGLLQKRDLQTALLTLSQTEQSVFRLKIEGYDHREIADMQGRKYKSVWDNVLYGRKKLHKQLN